MLRVVKGYCLEDEEKEEEEIKLKPYWLNGFGDGVINHIYTDFTSLQVNISYLGMVHNFGRILQS